jgi:hypothetical protein
MGHMNSKPSFCSLLLVAFLLFLSVACKQPKGREWDNAYPDQAGTLDVDGPPQVRAEENWLEKKWLDRRTAPKPLDESKPKEDDAKQQKDQHDGDHKK